jgi:hypothetical protein
MTRALCLLALAAAALLAGCGPWCAVRHAGDPTTTCINGKPHHVCDAPACPDPPAPSREGEKP